MSDFDALIQLMDSLPIYATKLGYRTDSTDAERALADDLFTVSRAWMELRDKHTAEVTAWAPPSN